MTDLTCFKTLKARKIKVWVLTPFGLGSKTVCTQTDPPF